MKILFLSFYFKPDLSAGSFRSEALINAMIKLIPSYGNIDLITTLPNRYKSFNSKASFTEKKDKLSIQRIKLPIHNNGIMDQSKAFLKFATKTIALSKDKKYDLVFATSSRLMTAALGAYISKRLKAPLYLDIRDIFTDTINDILPKTILWFIKPFFVLLEKFTINSAVRINLVSPGFLPYFRDKYPIQNFVFFTNGIDQEFVKIKYKKIPYYKNDPLCVVYAGNIGEGQGLEKIIPKLANRLKGKINFKIIGDGSKKGELLNRIKNNACLNIEILPPVKRDILINIYKDADILFLHLNNYESFKKVLPSKIFEYGATGKPIWAGVSGFSSKFIKNNLPNSSIFSPCDINEAERAFKKLNLISQNRTSFIKKYSRHKIMKQMSKDIICFTKGR